VEDSDNPWQIKIGGVIRQAILLASSAFMH
jgi:hypothetical protein